MLNAFPKESIFSVCLTFENFFDGEKPKTY